MSDMEKPLSAILAEFRQFALRAAEEDKMISPENVLLLADKVEAAADRTVDEYCAIIHEKDEAYDRLLLDSVPSNAAAMRAVLELLKKRGYVGLDGAFHVPIEDMSDQISAALSAPPRNCDVGTADEQTRRLRANCEKYKPSCKGCRFFTDIQRENCWLKWAQMPFAPVKGETK